MNDDLTDLGAPSDETWQPVRARLRDVAVPAEAREAAITAALAAFDEVRSGIDIDDGDRDDTQVLVAAAAETSAAPVISLDDRRRRQQRWLGTAAAAIAVLAVGGVVVGGLRGSSDQQVSVAPASAIESSAKVTDSAVGSVNDASGGSGQAEGGSPEALVDMSAATMTAQTDTVPTIASIDVAAAPETSAAPQSTAAPVPTEAIADAAALADYAARASAAPPMADLPTSECVTDGGTVLGVVSYQGTTAVVVLGADGTFRALAVDTCAVLATVRP